MFEKRWIVCLALAVLLGGPAMGQESTKKGGSVPITFLPPPIENATYSVGVYEVKTGKLVRRLCEAAGQNTFKTGLNGLITSWDGRDDDGKPLPPGKYAARGYAVGPLKVVGEAILGNDWAEDAEDLRPTRVNAIVLVPEDEGLGVLVSTGNAQWQVVRYKGTDGSLAWRKPLELKNLRAVAERSSERGHLAATLRIEGDSIIARVLDNVTAYRIADGEPHAPAAPTTRDDTDGKISLGKNESVWEIEKGVLSQLSMRGDVLRALQQQPPELLFEAVTASKKSERFYVLERKEGWWQRVRGLAWVETKEENGKPVSTWQTFFERNIRAPDPATGLGDAALANSPSPTVELPLSENALAPGKHESARLTATHDDKGSYLATADGLRLRLISERAGLHAVKLTREDDSDALRFFQTDGAAWDQFSIKGAKTLVPFDAGEFEIDAAGEKPVAEKAAEPDL